MRRAEQYLRVSEAARMLKLHRSRLYFLKNKGRIPYEKHAGLIVFHVGDLRKLREELKKS